MAKFLVTIEVQVAETWIEDGYDLTHKKWKERIEEDFQRHLPYAVAYVEIKAKVVDSKLVKN